LYSAIKLPTEIFLQCASADWKVDKESDWLRLDEPELGNMLIAFEKKMLPDTRYKFGVLRVKDAQNSEDAIFSNG
jgi:hypothetical protein